MTSLQTISPIQPLWSTDSPAASEIQNGQPSMFTEIFQSMINNVKETDAAKNEAVYALVTGQLDNPAEDTIAATQASIASELLVHMRNRALDAYSELMRISI